MEILWYYVHILIQVQLTWFASVRRTTNLRDTIIFLMYTKKIYIRNNIEKEKKINWFFFFFSARFNILCTPAQVVTIYACKEQLGRDLVWAHEPLSLSLSLRSNSFFFLAFLGIVNIDPALVHFFYINLRMHYI